MYQGTRSDPRAHEHGDSRRGVACVPPPPSTDLLSPFATRKLSLSANSMAHTTLFSHDKLPAADASSSPDCSTEKACAGGGAATGSPVLTESELSANGCNSSGLQGSHGLSLLDPVVVHHASLQRTFSNMVSPLGCSRSCESTCMILDYGVTAEQGVRQTMEDQHTMLAEGIPFFGVYDGHGGTQCAEYLRDNLHTMILGHPEIKTNPEKAIRDGIIEADRRFLEMCAREKVESGSVCAVALFVGDSVVVGNVGDAEVVLCRDGQPVVLTVPHNPKRNAKEVERVIAAGGRVLRSRVGHPKYNPAAISLAVSRAIGDAGFKQSAFTDGKPSGVIAVPDTTSIKLTPEDEFLLIGCDGLWDVLPHAEAVTFCRDLVRSGCSASDITERLVDEAIAKGTTDNVTVAFISCKPTSRPQGSPSLRLTRSSLQLSSSSSTVALSCRSKTSPMRCGQ